MTDKQSEATAFIPVHEPKTGRLLFRYDPERQLIEIQRRKVITVVDLAQYHSEPSNGKAVITLSDSA